MGRGDTGFNIVPVDLCNLFGVGLSLIWGSWGFGVRVRVRVLCPLTHSHVDVMELIGHVKYTSGRL